MPLTAKQFKNPALGVFLAAFVAAILVGIQVAPTWTVEKFALEVQTNDEGQEFVDFLGKQQTLDVAIPLAESPLTVDNLVALHQQKKLPEATEQLVYETLQVDGEPQKQYAQLSAHRHWGWWSFLPAFTAIALCWITKEPITSLLAGIVVGAMLIGRFNVLDGVLIPSIGTPRAATILVLYLWLLGGLMGIWAKTGASEAFADYMSEKFVRGPRTAKLVAWMLGVIFFQGGTVSAVLVGTTVRPLADEEKVCHEELALIVDATSSPIAVLLAFNAWPIYVQAFIGVAGVSYLATEEARIAFFFRSIPLGFYAIFSVLATLLIALEKHPALPKKLKLARQRALETGELNAPGSEPLAGGRRSELRFCACRLQAKPVGFCHTASHTVGRSDWHLSRVWLSESSLGLWDCFATGGGAGWGTRDEIAADYAGDCGRSERCCPRKRHLVAGDHGRKYLARCGRWSLFGLAAGRTATVLDFAGDCLRDRSGDCFFYGD